VRGAPFIPMLLFSFPILFSLTLELGGAVNLVFMRVQISVPLLFSRGFMLELVGLLLNPSG